MKTWTKEERYRVLKCAEEIKALHEHTILSDYRQHYHIQSVTGLLMTPTALSFMTACGTSFISGAHGEPFTD